MPETELVFFVNCVKVVLSDPDPETTLLQYLRNKLRLTGSKLGCGEGGCGACTVMVSRYDPQTDKITHCSVNACLAPLCSMHGLAVTTVEGIGSTKTRLHPVQERLAKAHGSQCGFCTPGIVMSMYTLLRNQPQPSRQQTEDCLDGNLCRCTGYRPILEGFNSFAKSTCAMGDNCCRAKSGTEKIETGMTNGCDGGNGNVNGYLPYEPSQEPIFPPELKIKAHAYETSLQFGNGRVTWYRPVTLDDLYDLKARYPKAKLLNGNTEVGIETKFKNMEYPVLIAATHIRELNTFETADDGVHFGSSVSLAKMDTVLKKVVEEIPEHKSRVFRAVIEMLKLFAGQQIRNVASIGGNIMTASPISDLNPLFMASGAVVTVGSKGNKPRGIVMDGDFFTGYRTTVINPEDILLSVKLPYTSENEYFSGYKQAHRKEDDIAIVNAGMKVKFKTGSDVVEDITLAYGGMAITTLLASKTMKALRNKKWTDELMRFVGELLPEDLPLSLNAPGGMTQYRSALTVSFFFKFYTEVKQRLQKDSSTSVSDAVGEVPRGLSEGVQVYQSVGEDQNPDDAVGRPLVHMSAFQQTTGEAIFIDDLPKVEGELYAAFVYSTKAHARLVSVDPSEALKMTGVVDYVCFRDIPGRTTWGIDTPDEQEVFASEKVSFQGQIIGCVLGDTQAEVQRAVKKIKVEYEELEVVITIQDAISRGEFFDSAMCLENGNLDQGFQESDHVIQDELHIGPQEHFYLETVGVIARPTNEDGGMEILASTQFPSEIQHNAAAVLGVMANKIVVRVKRIGGAFGGKESSPNLVVLPIAVAAAKVNRPVRVILDRDEDMVLTGERHAFLAKYKIGFLKSGQVKALDVGLYANCGNRLDLSSAVVSRAMFSIDNAYNIPNIKVKGYRCKTNIASATAFRGFGTPQAMLVVETLIDRITDVLKIDPHEVREINLYNEGDFTFYGQEVSEANIRKLWDDCIKQSEYMSRKIEVDSFNSVHRWKKRGIALIPTKYPLSYPARVDSWNQACALVTAYMDGSVIVSHCGTEMGQGLHTKMIQVASRALGIPTSQIYINDTCTDKMHMTCATAASVGSDLNGGAVKNACEILAERLQPFKADNPKGTFKNWVNAAYEKRIHLSVAGHYRSESLDFNFVTNKGRNFNYFTCGVACSEVEIDCLTGDHQVLRTDIVMDVGKSLNPAIDIGQIEGAFMQGYGLYLLEQSKTSPSGTLLTRGPGTYKIPGCKNIPVEMNVTLLKDSGNTRAVYSSKGIGEPPLFLASSVFFAVKDAIKSARQDAGHGRQFRLDSPATPERIRMACADQFTGKQMDTTKTSKETWFVEL